MQETKLPGGGTVITFSQQEMDEMETKIARDHGMTLAEYRNYLKTEIADHWCSCESSDSANVIFCDDGQVINEHCCSKHHYHCGACRKIVQVG